MISKLLTILLLMTSFSIRTPYEQPNPYDYELIAGIEGKFNNFDNKFSFKFLYEREDGNKYNGHDMFFEYSSKDILLNNFLSNVIYKRKVSSYRKDAINMNIQTIDTSYKIFKNIFTGYSIIANNLQNGSLLYYISLNYDFLIYNFRINLDKIVSDLYIGKKFPIYKNLFFHPYVKYIQNDNLSFIQGKAELEYSI